MRRQLDICGALHRLPYDYTLPAPPRLREPRTECRLRRQVWRACRADGIETVAADVGVSPLWLTAWLRGEVEADEQTIGRLYSRTRE